MTGAGKGKSEKLRACVSNVIHEKRDTDQPAYFSSLINGAQFRRIYTVSGEVILSDLFFPPSGKGSALKGKNLLPVGAIFSLLE